MLNKRMATFDYNLSRSFDSLTAKKRTKESCPEYLLLPASLLPNGAKNFFAVSLFGSQYFGAETVGMGVLKL